MSEIGASHRLLGEPSGKFDYYVLYDQPSQYESAPQPCHTDPPEPPTVTPRIRTPLLEGSPKPGRQPGQSKQFSNGSSI